MLLDAEILKAVLGPQAAGPAGFGINYEVDGGANIEANGGAAEVKLNEQSLAQARAQNEGGVNKEVAKTLAPQPKDSKSMTAIKTRQEKTDFRYEALFNKRTISGAMVNKITTAHGHHPNYRAALTPKNPLLRIRQRHLLQLRQTFDEIAQFRKKTVAVHPDMLSQQTRDKMIEVAASKGEHHTPVGAVPHYLQKGAYNAREWSKWGPSLMGGGAPRPGV